MGGSQIVYVFPFSWGNRERHKQNSQEISGKGRESPGTVPGQSRENFVYVFACFLVFFPALNAPSMRTVAENLEIKKSAGKIRKSRRDA